MSRLNWINCSRLPENERSSVVHVKCMRCKKDVHKTDAWQAIVRGKVKIVWCTSCKNNDHQPALFD